jgi:AcrR family transcriptional regulator
VATRTARTAEAEGAVDAATGPGRRAGLDADEVVSAALAIVARDGAGALSMRKLASELGVTTTTIYWHVGSREELIVAVIERVSHDLGARRVRGATPRDRVASVARSVWRSAFEHRNVTALAHQVGATSLLEMQLEVAMARELEAAGLTGVELRDALRSILMCVAGFLVVALRRGDGTNPELRSTTLWSRLDAPISAASRAALTEDVDVEALFERTLTAVVAAYVPA